MDTGIYPEASDFKAYVRSIYDRIHMHLRNIIANNGQSHKEASCQLKSTILYLICCAFESPRLLFYARTGLRGENSLPGQQ